RHDSGAALAGGRGHDGAERRQAGDREVRDRSEQGQPHRGISRQHASSGTIMISPPSPRGAGGLTTEKIYELDGSEGPGHRRLQGSGGDRGAGEGGRHGIAGPVSDHGGVGQGEHGDPVERGWGDQGSEGEAGGQGSGGFAA